MKAVRNQLALRKDFDFLPALPYCDCLSSWAHNLQDRVCPQNDQTRPFQLCREYGQPIKTAVAMDIRIEVL